MSAWSRFTNLWREKSLQRDFDEELRFHLDMQTARNVERGADPADAAAAARRELGSTLRAREGMHDARVMVWLESLAADVRHGARLLRRRGGAAALAILTLALGIGANTAIFSLLNAVLLRPMPFHDPDRLVVVLDRFSRLGPMPAPPTIPEIIDLRDRTQALSGIAFFDTRDFRITGGEEPSRVFTARVSATLFPTLGVAPALGRLFVDEDNLQGHWSVVVLSDGLWRRNFGADPAIVGRTIDVNGSAHTIVGVLPRGFSIEYPGLATDEKIEMYVPFQMYEEYTSRRAAFVNVRRVTTIARLRGGATREQASAELTGIARGIAAENPELYRRGKEDVGYSLDAVVLHDWITLLARGALTFLQVAVLLVLLIACVNTGQFMLAQSIDRESEVAVRASLGASRGRLFRQFLAESTVLAFAGGAVGLLLAFWLVRALLAVTPGYRPELDRMDIDGTVLLFTVGISFLSAVVVGVLPALYFSRADLSPRLAARGGAAAGHRARHVLVAAEVAIAVVLLAGAILIIDGARRTQNADHGFSPDDVTVMQIRGNGSQATRPIASVEYQRYLDRLAAVPGVEAAAAATPLPFRNAPGTEFHVEGRPEGDETGRLIASYQIVSPDYFTVFRVPLREGRVFSIDDVLGRPRVAIVGETLARRMWPDQSALGRQIRIGPNVLAVVGVVGDVQTTALERQRQMQIYVSNLQQFEPNMNLAIRTAPGVTVTDEAIKRAVWAVAPEQPVFNIRPMTEFIRGPMADQRYVATLLGAFAALALFMSATGVYTVVRYLVARRTREIAVRVAIGATDRDILRLVSAQTLGWTIVGLVVGIGVSVALRGVVAKVLNGISPIASSIAPALSALTVFYLAVALVAMAVPVLRTLRFLDPAAALRVDC